MTAAQISTAEVGQVPASASAYPDNDTRERPATVIIPASGCGKISSTTEQGRPGRGVGSTGRAHTPSDCTGRSPGAMMPWVDRAMLRTHATNVPAVTLRGVR